MDNLQGIQKEDIIAILKANRELGPDYDEHTADQLLRLIQHKISPTVSAENDLKASVPMKRRHKERGPAGTVTSVLALSIPLLAIAHGSTISIIGVLGLDAFIISGILFRKTS
ncbi:hypothetical protein [Sulfobacillus thermosulfidooxidans]|uniref:Uncharacterized protein n=1 Tax=Sulfobacillus thermosulfidooxidans (strain DSM 9293 / VKM B-1269 / AT-1) TaxID=929705 RepID=A0A1W1WHU4_SULTA|nr:hypothetical protein [Sulfobacillus thermosulfidooxidans]OLZ11223.1 hypothetical protein BFX05_08055 [Sulfobacillus thermosulfidooxidans]OLZ13438.1 hypothetical protein BFX06_09710 [Sulfobacillus thermosulfidooxidans]OLZ21685.1 hypothetical protein BFX07_12760 [Sulfobacillus thermosulfidooxidans]SMC05837.1 hypothetical protein SAMN00768000_2482 [Sulfobacillus thermosulfidooxidans DSM 9293]